MQQTIHDNKPRHFSTKDQIVIKENLDIFRTTKRMNSWFIVVLKRNNSAMLLKILFRLLVYRRDLVSLRKINLPIFVS